MAKSKKPAKKSKKKPSVAATAKLVAATRATVQIARTAKSTIEKAKKKSPGAARRAIDRVKTDAKAAGHMAEVAAEKATRVLATTAGVVAGIVESVSHKNAPVEKPRPSKKSKSSE